MKLKLPDTKTLIISGLVIVLIVSGWFHVEENEISQAYKLEKESAQRHIKKQIDSINSVIRRKDEQLLKAMRESAEADMIAKESVEKAEKYRKRYEAVVFVRYDSDSARQYAIRSVLKKANQTASN